MIGLKNDITIIIPCFRLDLNSGYLNSLLISIQHQELSNFSIQKVILVNDSPEYKINDYISLNSFDLPFHLIENEKNMGQAYSRNAGIYNTTSNFIHFIDQDDLLDSSFYRDIVKVSDCMISNCILFKEEKEIFLYKKIRIKIYNFYKSLSKLRWFLYFDNIILSPGQAVFKTDLIRSIGGFPILSSFGSDDYGLMFKLCQNDCTYTFSENSIFKHRLHFNQGKNYLKMEDSRAEALSQIQKVDYQIFIQLCKQQNHINKFLRKCIYILFNNLI